MSALAGLFGGLGGLANFGEQSAEAGFAAHDEIQKRLVEQQQQKETQFRQQLERQPQPFGPAYQIQGGGWVQRFRNPLTGALTVQQMPGPPAETQEQQEARGLKALGYSDEMIRDFMAKEREKTPPHSLRDDYDPATKQWYKVSYDPITMMEYGRVPEPPPAAWAPRVTEGYYTDQSGMMFPRGSIMQKYPSGQAPGQTPGMPFFPAPTMPFMPSGGTGPGTGIETPLAPARPGLPADTTFGSGFGGVDATGQALTGQGAPQVYTPQSVDAAINALPTLPTGQGYRGLDANGNIPPIPGIPPPILQTANDIMQGRNVTDIPANQRARAESIARKFGWPGQGALTPKDIVKIQEPASIIRNLLQPTSTVLQVLDQPGAWIMALAPSDIPQEATIGSEVTRLTTREVYQQLTPEQLNYLQIINQLRSLMGGFRQLTGGNVSEAQVTRYISELPDPVTTPNSAAAKSKLMKLYSELQLAMAYGYFPRESQDAGGANRQPQTGGQAAPATPPVSDDDFLMNVSKPPPTSP